MLLYVRANDRGAICEGIIHILRIQLPGSSDMRTYMVLIELHVVAKVALQSLFYCAEGEQEIKFTFQYDHRAELFSRFGASAL